MTVNLPADEFRSELNVLIDNSWVKMDMEWAFETFSGPLTPFRGIVFGNEFTLKRNVPWTWRYSKYIRGVYFEKNGVTEVSYSFATDYLQFTFLRIIALPFLLLSAGTPFPLIGLLLAAAVFCIVHFIDLYFKRKLEISFLTEMNMLPHNYKSRFKK